MDPFRPSQGYRQLDHPTDVAIEFWAPTEESLLVIGGQALVELLTGTTALERTDDYLADELRPVLIEAGDPTDRMVRWLNEVLVTAHTGCLLRAADLELGETSLQGTLYCDQGLIENDLAAVTDQEAELTTHEYGWYGRVVIAVG
ncbi:MAG TPA: archease [Kofleriaceae bacterium]|nr:archease [Kofleriaceae bacterium]